MRFAKFMVIAASATLMAAACGSPEPAPNPASEPSAAETAAAELQRKRNDAAAELDKRVGEVERRWTEMESKVKEKTAAPTAGLRTEIQEDLKNVREAVGDLKTTNLENWWERHERAMERTADDIEEDVRRFAKTKPTAGGNPPARGVCELWPLRIATRPIRRTAASESRLHGGTTQERPCTKCCGDGVGGYTGARQQAERGCWQTREGVC